MANILFWNFITISVLSFVFLTKDALSPFIVAFIIAYALEPAIYYISCRYSISRNYVTYFICIIFLSVILLLLIMILPLLYQQITLLLSKIPDYKHKFELVILPNLVSKISVIDFSLAQNLEHSIKGVVNSIFSLFSNFLNHFWDYTLATMNFIFFILLLPVLLIYIMQDFPKITNNFYSIIPLRHKNSVTKLLSEIHLLLSSYIRGQFNVCILLSFFYSIILTIIGCDFALLLGIISGFLIIIPIVGILISLILCLVVSYFTFGFAIQLIYILSVYIFGWIIESYILTPKIIGERIGLRPLSIIFAVLVIGNLFGGVGIFFAIPIAGVTKILLLHAVSVYKNSKFYN